VRQAEPWQMHLPIQIRERTENKSGALPLLSDRSHIRPMVHCHRCQDARWVVIGIKGPSTDTLGPQFR
jgi:hypothetical protein